MVKMVHIMLLPGFSYVFSWLQISSDNWKGTSQNWISFQRRNHNWYVYSNFINLWANSADDKLMIFFYFFPRK